MQTDGRHHKTGINQTRRSGVSGPNIRITEETVPQNFSQNLPNESAVSSLTGKELPCDALVPKAKFRERKRRRMILRQSVRIPLLPSCLFRLELDRNRTLCISALFEEYFWELKTDDLLEKTFNLFPFH